MGASERVDLADLFVNLCHPVGRGLAFICVGAIRRTRQGVFEILPRDRGNCFENRSIEKTVLMVATVNYELERYIAGLAVIRILPQFRYNFRSP
jgi:hypothetical protein